MPINKEAYIRYSIIDKCLRHKYRPYPSMAILVEECSSILGKTFSSSTIQKDIKAMKEDDALGYNAPIAYSRSYNGYYYSVEDYSISSVPLNQSEVDSMLFAANILSQFKGSRVGDSFNTAIEKVMTTLKYNNINGKESFPMVMPEICSYFKGYELIDLLIENIKSRQIIIIEHYSYRDQQSKTIKLHPYLLKEHRNKWYLVGYSEHHKCKRIFGLDRISGIKAVNETFCTPEFDPISYFKHAIGVFIKENTEVTKVTLKFDEVFSSYVQAQPIHVTQQIVEIKKSYIKLTIDVFPSVELAQLLLGYGKGVKVLSPKWLINEMKTQYSEALNQYK